MADSINTSICAAAKIVVGPVKFQQTTYEGKPYWFATQTLEFTTHDGQKCSIVAHLQEGCVSLTPGEPVVMPVVPVGEGESA